MITESVTSWLSSTFTNDPDSKWKIQTESP